MKGIIVFLVAVTCVSAFGSPATAVPVVPPDIDDTEPYVEMGAIEDIYTADGATLLKTVRTPAEPVGQFTATELTSAVAVHASTGCHKVRVFQTGYSSIVGSVLWRYWVRTYSCWSKAKRLVYNVSNAVMFTRLANEVSVTHNLLDSARYFYNPTGLFDPFPLPGVNSHSAYYNWSKGEVEMTCGGVVTPVHACWARPSGTIKSLYTGNWWTRSGSDGGIHTG